MQHTIRYRTKLKNWLGTSRIPLLEDVCICTIDYECIDKCVAELRDENLAMILVFYISTILEMSSGLRASGLRAAVCGAHCRLTSSATSGVAGMVKAKISCL